MVIWQLPLTHTKICPFHDDPLRILTARTSVVCLLYFCHILVPNSWYTSRVYLVAISKHDWLASVFKFSSLRTRLLAFLLFSSTPLINQIVMPHCNLCLNLSWFFKNKKKCFYERISVCNFSYAQKFLITLPLYLIFDGLHVVGPAYFAVSCEVQCTFRQHVQLSLVLNVCLARQLCNYSAQPLFTTVCIKSVSLQSSGTVGWATGRSSSQ